MMSLRRCYKLIKVMVGTRVMTNFQSWGMVTIFRLEVKFMVSDIQAQPSFRNFNPHLSNVTLLSVVLHSVPLQITANLSVSGDGN